MPAALILSDIALYKISVIDYHPVLDFKNFDSYILFWEAKLILLILQIQSHTEASWEAPGASQ